MNNTQLSVFFAPLIHFRILASASIKVMVPLLFSIMVNSTPTITTNKPNIPSLSTPNTASRHQSDAEKTEHQAEEKIAYALVKSAAIIESNNKIYTLLGFASNEASSRLQSFLASYGTSHVQLGIKDDFKLGNSQFDLLIPFAKQDYRQLFSQFIVHHTSDQTTMNVGLGQRHFMGDQYQQMLAYNLFYDSQLSSSNRRLGIGTEWWQDNLKLSGNGYFQLTNWVNTERLKKNNERIANGFDLRAEGYLPTLPQLGATVKYEQYFGDEVALFSQNNRQNDPIAVTAGVNYTPFPLISMGIAHKRGASNRQETQLTLGLNYEIGSSWEKQISATAVAEKRSLVGSRYQLVERNNNMVSEYKKQQLIQLSLPKKLAGNVENDIPLTLSVNAKYGLQKIVFDAPEFITAGGHIHQSDHNYLIKLPALDPTTDLIFPISAVAYDTKGNTSERAFMILTIRSTNNNK